MIKNADTYFEYNKYYKELSTTVGFGWFFKERFGVDIKNKSVIKIFEKYSNLEINKILMNK